MKKQPTNSKYLRKISHKRIDPPALTGDTSLTTIVEDAFRSYNAGRLREACRLFTQKMLADDVTVGLSLSGQLTPAGLGISRLEPVIAAGALAWIISNGANHCHEPHPALAQEMHQHRPR